MKILGRMTEFYEMEEGESLRGKEEWLKKDFNYNEIIFLIKLKQSANIYFAIDRHIIING